MRALARWIWAPGAALLALTAEPVPAAPAEVPFRYHREADSPERAVRLLVSAAAERGCDALTVVFDLATFDPPPGASEWTSTHAFREDLPAWFAALDAAAASGRMPIYAAATNSSRPVEVSGAWALDVRGRLVHAWWNDRRFKRFEPAERWARRLVAATPGRRRALALIASEFPPEAWRETPRHLPNPPPRWPAKLLERGEAFSAERVGAAVRARGGVFLVVAPEVSFGDFLPVEDLPKFPWVARPAGAVGARIFRPAVTGGRGGGRGGGPRERPPGRGDRSAEEEARDGYDPGGRFLAATPRFQARFPHVLNTDCPSAYGFWPYARAAAKTGGAYVFYPFPEQVWADDCPRDEPLVEAMRPELTSAAELERTLRADPVTDLLARAQRLVLDETPWSDSGSTSGGSGPPRNVRGVLTSWFGFESQNGALRPAVKWRPRDVPIDTVGGGGNVQQWRDYGIELARSAVRHDAALDLLEEGARELAAKNWKGVSRRSRANLRLARYWCAMSGFHIHALSNYLTSIERWMPREPEYGMLITHLDAIKMSDCLDAYDGRTISWAQERSYGWATPYREKGGQGNFLRVPTDDANYRARRDLDCVMLHLDPRLIAPARRMIDAAQDVMRHEARSGWGWVTYYSAAETFIWQPVPPPPKGPVGGGKSKEKGPKTPRDSDGPSGPRSGGSSGGGPSTE